MKGSRYKNLHLPDWLARRELLLLTVGLLLAFNLPSGANAQQPNRAGLVVAHGDGAVATRCVEFAEAEISGLKLLERSGLDLIVDVSSGIGATVCRIDGQGCDFPVEDCFCQCKGGATCTYWAYWHLAGETWQYSNVGASGYKVRNGDVEGWTWGAGAAPPQLSFADICPTLPTSTPTPQPTATDTPLPTPTFTPPPPPTPTAPPATPTPLPPTSTSTATATVEPVATASPATASPPAGITPAGAPPAATAATPPTATPTLTPEALALAAGGETAEIAQSSTPASRQSTSQTNPQPALRFSAEADTLQAGECTTLRWLAENASAVYLDGTTVKAEASHMVCPSASQAYTLRVLYPYGQREATLHIQVVGTPTVLPGVKERSQEKREEEMIADGAPSGVGSARVVLLLGVSMGMLILVLWGLSRLARRGGGPTNLS